MLETCVLTVRSEMPSSSAIRLFAKPRACAITSPVLSPARTRSGTPLRSSARWISIAHRTARRALENASMNLSPSRSTSTPPVRSSAWRTSRSCSRKSSRARSSPSRSTSGVEFSMSVKTTVTVPSGRPCSPPCTRRRTRRVASVQSTGSPRWTLRIACAISSGLVSLVRKPDAPAARVGRTWSSSLNVESASTFTSGERSRSSSVALMPSTSGMTTSMTTTSGRSSCARSTAAAPFSASPTTSTSGCTSRNSRSPCRTTAWSSAIRTRMVSVKIDLHVDCRAGARRGAHLERAADRLRALPHRDQPEPPPRLRAFGVEARAVVLDGDDQPAAARPQPHAHVLRARVLERVRERLLDDAKDFALVLDTRLATAVDVELDVRAVDAPQDVDVLLERRREPVRGDVRRPELEDERAHLGHRAADELAHLPELLLRLLRLGLDEERGGVGGQRDAEESLVHGVVELAREAVSLLDHRQLAAALVEPRVLDRDRRVARGGQLPRRVGELLEHGLEAVLGRDRDDGVADRAEGAAIERLWHGSSRYAARGGCGRAARALSGTVVSRPSGFDGADGGRRKRSRGVREPRGALERPAGEAAVEKPGGEGVACSGAVHRGHVWRRKPPDAVHVTPGRAELEDDIGRSTSVQPLRRALGPDSPEIACASARLGTTRSRWGRHGSTRDQRPVGSHTVSRLVTRPRRRAPSSSPANGSPSSPGMTSAPATCSARPA